MSKYIPMPLKKKKKNIGSMKRLISKFVVRNGYKEDEVSVNIITLSRIIDKVHQRERYFSYFHSIKMSELKQIALNCFWIIKLHPIDVVIDISENTQFEFRSINEKFAVYYLISHLKTIYAEKTDIREAISNFFDDSYLHELVYTFTFRDISKEAMILLVETIAKGVGIQPYNVKRKNEL